MTADRAVLAIDLGEDKQVAVVLDHDGRVLGRRTVLAKAHGLGRLLQWAADRAAGGGFASVVVGCEPTGHRWRAVMQLADDAGMGFVCVQSLQVHRSREADDYTRDKTDHKDAVLIGKLVARLDCYLPERADTDWARLRHLGSRRRRLVTQISAVKQQITDLLSCCWPAMLDCAAQPMRSTTWQACLAATVAGGDGDPARWAGRSRDEFTAAVRDQLTGSGVRRVSHPIIAKVMQAWTDPAGVHAQRPGGLERIGFLMQDWQDLTRSLAETEQRMTGVLDALGLTALVSSIPGVSAVGAAAILAETGDPARFASARSLVKHAGLNPAENTSATFHGRSKLSRRGRPGLRLAAWRAVWGALPHNPALHAKYTHLTRRDHDQLTPNQARAACAAALLRWIHAITTRREPFQPGLAAPDTHRKQPAIAA